VFFFRWLGGCAAIAVFSDTYQPASPTQVSSSKGKSNETPVGASGFAWGSMNQ